MNKTNSKKDTQNFIMETGLMKSPEDVIDSVFKFIKENDAPIKVNFQDVNPEHDCDPWMIAKSCNIDEMEVKPYSIENCYLFVGEDCLGIDSIKCHANNSKNVECGFEVVFGPSDTNRKIAEILRFSQKSEFFKESVKIVYFKFNFSSCGEKQTRGNWEVEAFMSESGKELEFHTDTEIQMPKNGKFSLHCDFTKKYDDFVVNNFDEMIFRKIENYIDSLRKSSHV